jgi:hypothetical protein
VSEKNKRKRKRFIIFKLKLKLKFRFFNKQLSSTNEGIITLSFKCFKFSLFYVRSELLFRMIIVTIDCNNNCGLYIVIYI